MKNRTINHVKADGCMKYGKKREDERKVCHFTEIFGHKNKKSMKSSRKK